MPDLVVKSQVVDLSPWTWLCPFLRVLRGEAVMPSEARYVLLGKFNLHHMFTGFINSIGAIDNTSSKGFLNLHQPVLKLLDAVCELRHGISRTQCH